MTNAANTETLTYGVEVETKGISRQRAATVIAATIGGAVQCEGGYYDKWVAVDAQGRKWTAMSDASIGRENAEIVSPVLRGREDMDTLQNIVRALRRAGARVDNDCGIHVHVGAQDMDSKAIGNLAAMTFAYEPMIQKALGIVAQRAHWCRPITEEKAKALKSARSIRDVRIAWYGSESEANSAAHHHYHSSRYAGLNLHSLFYANRGTVEFRYFNATLHAGKLRAYVSLCLALVAHAKAAKSCSVKRAALCLGDEKWTMYRLCYHKLGLRGDHYKAVREHLTDALPGRIDNGSARRARDARAVAA